MEHTPGGVSVPADVPSEAPAATAATEAPAASETPTAKAEDVTIEDADFLAQLDEFEDK
jgi:hypothetical protein